MSSAKKLKLFVYLSFFVHLAGGLAIYFYYHPIHFAPKAAGEREAKDFPPDEKALSAEEPGAGFEDFQSAFPGASKAKTLSGLKAGPSKQPLGESKALSGKRRSKKPPAPEPPPKKAAEKKKRETGSLTGKNNGKNAKALSKAARAKSRPSAAGKTKKPAGQPGLKGQKPDVKPSSAEAAKPAKALAGALPAAAGIAQAGAEPGKSKSYGGRSGAQTAASLQKESAAGLPAPGAGAAFAGADSSKAGQQGADNRAMSQKEADELLNAAEALVSDGDPKKTSSLEKINLNGSQLEKSGLEGKRGAAAKTDSKAAGPAKTAQKPSQKLLPEPKKAALKGGAKLRAGAGKPSKAASRKAAQNPAPADSSKTALAAEDKTPENDAGLVEGGEAQKVSSLGLEAAGLAEKAEAPPAGRKPERGLSKGLENMELVEDEEEGEEEDDKEGEDDNEESGEDDDDEGGDEEAGEDGEAETAPAASGRPGAPPLAEKPKARAVEPKLRDFSELRQKRGNPSLAYPEIARREKMQGSVSVIYFVGPGGLVDQIQLKSSSGHSDLDNFVLRTLVRYKFLPGQEGWVSHKVKFQLEGVEQERLQLRER